jgi:hypothetical protein
MPREVARRFFKPQVIILLPTVSSSTPGVTPLPQTTTTINYLYDPLNRLTEANYSNGDYYHYAGVYPEPAEGMPSATARPSKNLSWGW